MYKAPPPEVSSEQFYETDPTKPYKRGWSIQTVSPLPITWAEHVTAQGHWGAVLREYMRDYVHWATLGALCEFLPQAGQPGHPRRREGPARPAGRALRLQPVRQRQAADRRPRSESMEAILRAAGATEVMTIERYAHLVGGARMAARAEDGVVDADHRVFGVAGPLRRRRQRAAHPGLGQPGADDHGAGRPGRRPADRRRPRRPGTRGGVMTAREPAIDRRPDGRRLPLPDPVARGRRHAGLGRHHRRHRRGRRAAGAPGWAGPTAAGRGRRADRRRAGRGASAGATPSTSPAPGRRCTGPAATSAPAGCSCRRISAVDIALWDLKARLLDVAAGRPVRPGPRPGAGLRLGRLHHADRRPARRAGRGVAGGRLHRDEDQDRRVVGQPTGRATSPGCASCASSPATTSS